jgi:hypothetical protein
MRIYSREYIIIQMPKSRIILVIGFFIALLPVLGFPHAWESFFQVVGGLGIVFLSVMIAIDKRLTQKVKAERRLRRRRERMEVSAPAPEPFSPPINDESSVQQ